MHTRVSSLRSVFRTLALAATVLAAPQLARAVPVFSNSLHTINVDGSTVLGGSSASFAYEAGTYHMWYRPAGYGPIGNLRHATSTDGINFTDQGALSFSNDPFPTGTPPWLGFENVSKVGSDWVIQHWTYYNGGGSYNAAYSYNLSLSTIGSDPNNLSVNHDGALTRLGQDTSGSAGIVGDTSIFGPTMSRWLAGGPFTGTGYDLDLLKDFSADFTAAGNATGYINNHGDVVPVPGGLGYFFDMRANSGARFANQIYYSESLDGGATWSSATGLFSAPTLDGSPLAYAASFSHADVVDNGSGLVLYLNTRDADGNYVIATTLPVPEPGTVALVGTGALALALRQRRRA